MILPLTLRKSYKLYLLSCDPVTYLEKILQTVSTVFCDPATYLEKILQTVSTVFRDPTTLPPPWKYTKTEGATTKEQFFDL